MAYQLLFQQEQYVSCAGYNMFFRFVPYAIMRCRELSLRAASLRAPHLQVDPLGAPQELDAGPMPVRELGELSDSDKDDAHAAGRARLRVVQFNQKDDYLHRGQHPLLRCMSLVMYSRFVHRVDRAKAGKPGGTRFFEFAPRYPHYEGSLQDSSVILRIVVSCVVVMLLVAWDCRQHRRGALGSPPAARVRDGEVRCVHAWFVISFSTVLLWLPVI